jgi:hypothetical protein
MRRARHVCVRAASGALLPPAAFAVHQLRYMLAYGAATGPELERTGHSYLHSAVPWLIMLLALTAGTFLRALGRAFSRQTTVGRYGLSFVALWITSTTALVVIFAGQELLEGIFAAGHPAGLSGIFSYGGWWAVPAAACIGLVLAALFHGARWIVDEVARRATRTHRVRRLRAVPATPSRSFRLTPEPLLAGWSTRGPPVSRASGSSR